MINAALRYLAGFADADGCFFVYCTHKEPARPWFVPSFNVTNTNPAIPEAFARLFGGKVHSKGKPEGNRRQAYQWVAQFDKARVVAQALLPYLVMKHRQAEIIRDWPAGIKGFAPKPETVFRPRSRYSRSVRAERLAEQAVLYAEIRKLNGRTG